MGPLGVPELIIIFIVALLVFGPRKLPELGKSLGKGLSEFRRASNELRNTLEEEVRAAEYEPPPPPPQGWTSRLKLRLPILNRPSTPGMNRRPRPPSEAEAGDAVAEAVSVEQKAEAPSQHSEADTSREPESGPASSPGLSSEPKPEPKPDGH